MTQAQIEETNKKQTTVKQGTAMQGTPVKTYVLDTTVLINDPDIVTKLKGKVVIPLAVVGQLDGLKNNENIKVAQRARQASRAILEAQNEGKVKVINNFKKGINVLDSEADNKIIGICLTLKEQGEDVNLLTTDVNMQITARSMGVGTKEIEDRRKIIMDFIFKGILPLGGLITLAILFIIYLGVKFTICIFLFTVFFFLVGYLNSDSDSNDDVLTNPVCFKMPGNIFHKYD